MGRRFYRIMLVLVVILAVVYTLGLMGLVPFRYSTYITLFFLLVFVLLRVDYHSKHPK